MYKLLDQIEALLDEGGEHGPGSSDLNYLPVLRGTTALLRAVEAFFNGQADRAIAYSEEAMALLPSGGVLFAAGPSSTGA